ncbi:MAG: DNA repair protein RecN [Spirochaetaceae bacterium]|jgi:DNA repair protein RecN (Recombination protein N)|nr:DNA repair protein RecN [Spirochaetaceae bacterium]
MLEELNIHNYALIDSVSLSFQNGFTVLSGETGSGKSIIVGAIGFLLGAKSDSTVVRVGSESAVVQALVSIKPENTDAHTWLTKRDIETNEGRIVIRRTMKLSGRGSIYLQNIQITRTDLTEFMALLFNLHGQHTHESLLAIDSHLVYLDRFAGLESDLSHYRKLFSVYSEKKRELEYAQQREHDRDARQEILRYVLDEIDKVSPKPGESRELEVEARRLSEFEKLSSHIKVVSESFFEDENSALSFLRKARFSLENATDIDESLTALSNRMKDWYYEAEDIAEEIRIYRNTVRYNPERLEEVEDRLSLLFRLKKKYGTDEKAILAYRDAAQKEIDSLSELEADQNILKHALADVDKALDEAASALSKKRKESARDLETRISKILSILGMPNAQFSVTIQECKRMSTGTDAVEFLFSANLGEPPRELARIASGGELSRVMLAIKTVLSSTDTLETLIFDEIDSGVGGAVALAVGEYLAQIAQLKQIFCVTHLASIALRADHHIKVEKKDQGNRTVTNITVLDHAKKRQEIARMLSGDVGTAALAHADALLARYGQ